ncbi:MAG: tyrosine-type recombinase/integrase [Clostridia bacterium]|nr:tyrosine-type recombinase/integrase [Clostridia bacterium]
MSLYTDERAKSLTILTRDILRELPDACNEFILSIADTTQPLTRYVYAGDLKLFCEYLIAEVPSFANCKLLTLSHEDFGRVTVRDLRNYMDYLSYYIKNNVERTNSDQGKMRKLSSLRAFYEFLYKSEYIQSDVSKLVDLPKRHEKPILRMEIDEVARMLDYVETGEALSDRQKKYNEHTRVRDLAILTLFLGTGIRVSELVGLNIEDINFELNAFMITRKGGDQAVLYFSEEVADVIKQYLTEVRKKLTPQVEDEKALFLSLQNKRISVRAVQMMVKKYAVLAAPLKKRLSPHKLRSTFGTNLYNETGDIYLVADVLGHSDVNTTRRHYAAMSDEHRRTAAKRVKLRDNSYGTTIENNEPTPENS